MTTIYGLVDPRTGAVRYVGRAKNPRRRLRSHVEGTVLGCPNFGVHRHDWLDELRACGLDPLMVSLEECDDADRGRVERKWIEHYLPTGLLTNQIMPIGDEAQRKVSLILSAGVPVADRDRVMRQRRDGERMSEFARRVIFAGIERLEEDKRS